MTAMGTAIHEDAPRRYRRYPAYKDSGVEWLGKIPEHWEIKRLRTTVRSCQNGVWGDEPDGLQDIACVRVADFDRVCFRVNIEDPTLRSIELRVASARGLKQGDLLLEKSGGGENQPVGAVVLYDHRTPAVCSNFVARVVLAKGFDSRFMTYLHATLYSLRINTRHIKQSTGIQNLDSTSYLDEVVGLPSEPDEQLSIASFLDRETAQIDALVAKKRRLIELLQEQRTALITRAVTKGLDLTVPMKDSGVEWLGEIPEHWEVLKTTWLFSIGSGTTPSSEDPSYYGGDTPWITTSELRESVILSTEKSITGDALKEHSSLKVYPTGSVAVAMYGATIGRLGIFGTPATVNQACCVFSKERGVDTQYWFYWLQMRRPYLISLGYGGGQPNLSQDLLRALRVPTPPPEEQVAIAAFIDREASQIDALIAKVCDAIAHLQELRTALISAAVTGKIDVREEVL